MIENYKSPEKRATERLNYLKSQIGIFDSKKAQLEESQEYQDAQESLRISLKKAKEPLDNLHIHSTIFPDSVTKEELEIAEHEYQQKYREEQAKFDALPINQAIQQIQEKTRELSKEFDTLHKEKNENEKSVFDKRKSDLQKNIETLTEKVFESLEKNENEFLQPNIDLGMTKDSALTALANQDRNAFILITRLQEYLDDLDNFSDSVSHFEFGSYRSLENMERIENLVQNISNNIL